jgi:hypothetical protein
MADYLTEIRPREQKASSDSLMDNAYEVIRGNEGFIPTTKIPTQGDRNTIGHGHTGQYARPGATITRPQAGNLLVSDMRSRLAEIKRMTPRFEELDEVTQKRIMDSHFRGSWGGSPDTRRLVNEGNFTEASTEFLDNDEYRNAVARGRAGIRGRMEETSRALANARYREAVKEPAGPKIEEMRRRPVGMVTGRM